MLASSKPGGKGPVPQRSEGTGQLVLSALWRTGGGKTPQDSGAAFPSANFSLVPYGHLEKFLEDCMPWIFEEIQSFKILIS